MFDLKEGKYIGADSFENVFNQIKSKARFNKIQITEYDLPVFLEFPKLRNGEDANKALAECLGLKSAGMLNDKDEQYKLYSFELTADISQDGSLEIEGVYIPKNLGECLTELDKMLAEVDKKEMQALPDRSDMIRYHIGLGMWVRNYWGLWGGSRLEKYFADKARKKCLLSFCFTTMTG